MPPRKRKATEEAGSPAKSNKKSKKEKLDEARARARQWAEEEASKKNGGSKGSSSAKKTPIKSPSRPFASSTIGSTPSHRVPKKPTSVGSAKQVKAESPRPISSTKKLSVEQRRAEARARAKAWAAEQQSKKLTKENEIAFKSSDQLDEEDAVMDDDVEEVEAVLEQQEEEQVKVEPAPVRRAPARRSPGPPTAPPPFGSPSRPKKKVSNNCYTEDLPPTMSESDVASHMHDLRKQQSKIRLNLERHIQDQVLSNAMAEISQELVQQDVVRFVQQQQLPPSWQQDQILSECAPRRSRPLFTATRSTLLLSGVGIIAAVLMLGRFNDAKAIMIETVNGIFGPGSSIRGNKISIQKVNSCFVDNYEFADVENPPESPFQCDKSLERIPCPGRCADGRLLFCNETFLTTASDGSSCVLSSSANMSLAQVETLLTNWTTRSFCDLQGLDFARRHGKAPVFPLSKVIEQIEIKVDVLDLSPDFIVEEDNGEYFVGLSDNYADTKFSIPTLCWISLLTVDFFIAAATNGLNALTKTSSIIFSICLSYPTVAFSCLLIFLLLFYVRHRAAAQKKLLMDVATIRQLAYEKLMGDAGEHLVLHIRDGIAMDLHPTSKKDRSYIILKVWPRVVADVRMDNRIRKASRRSNGKPRDVWQWVASTSSRTAASQNSD